MLPLLFVVDPIERGASTAALFALTANKTLASIASALDFTFYSDVATAGTFVDSIRICPCARLLANNSVIFHANKM